MRAVSRLANRAARQMWLARNSAAFRDTETRRRPRLLVDVSVIMRHDAATGIQRVVRSIWSHLRILEGRDFDVLPVHAGRSRGYCFAPGDFLMPDSRPGHIPVGVRPGDKFLGLDLSAHYLPNYIDQLAAWKSNGASLHFVIYDLLPLTRPDWFMPSTSRNFARWLDTVATIGDQALCISDTVVQELGRRIIGTPAHERLTVGRLHLSGDIAGSLPSAGLSLEVRSVLARLRSRPSILMIGTIEPRKGYDRALDAFSLLWDSDGDTAPDLVIIGKRGWKTAALQERIRNHPQHGQRLHWLENVSDEALTKFYGAALGVFIASYDEGFGLPLVEAARHRRWVLARDLPVFAGQRLLNVIYFSHDSPDALAHDLRDLVRVASGGLPPTTNSPKWSWCVERLIEEIGLAREAGTGQPPALRLVS